MLLPTPKLLLLLALPLIVLLVFPGRRRVVLVVGYDAALLLVAGLTRPALGPAAGLDRSRGGCRNIFRWAR